MKHVGLRMKNEEGGVASEYEQTDRLSMNQKDWSNMALAHKMVKIKKCVFFSFNLAQNFHIVLNILDAYSGVSKYTLYI